ncbi:hypothetical protein K458DRAFT_359972 [Lentithecium fluviatile CBS 122367]|uniref:Uncharacterized protein n=1 Tax=Lentithecium fluviatile CBS 122367 TaxID=1168545 RepID=A0A6G1JEF3_9PLEO|nr:hypothetical protein K458DRAFT_359972 [Lentithecium fluviatile CBS 122367]
MSSGALTPQVDFAQNGTLDWVRLGGGMMAFLGRVVNYGVDPFTVVLGAQMAQQLPLGPRGQENARNAVNRLRSVASFNKLLWFGFGITSLPQLLASQVEGLAFLAVTAALSEVYHEDVVTKILHEILLQYNPPREATPSLQSWAKIVNACAGTFSTSSFGKRAETLMALHPAETSLFAAEDSSHFNEKWRSRSAPKDIAKALISLGKVSRREIDSITITGGGDAGCLAAIAEYLFDMSIVIDDENRNRLYFNSIPGPAIQAHFIYKSRNSVSSSGAQHQDLEASKKVVHLKDIADILFANDQTAEAQLSGRLPWSCCLSVAFGSTFQILKATNFRFGNILGCAARIFQAVARAESEIDLETRRNWIYYTDSGSGLGYVQNLMYWFPELKAFETSMQEATGLSYRNARNDYQSDTASLARQCSCVHCSPSASEQAPEQYCVVALVETILKAALILSNVTIEHGLEPKRFGFDRLYQRQLATRPKDDTTRERMEQKLGPIVWVIEPEKEDERFYTVDHRIRLMMDGAMGLFSYLTELDSSSCTAWSRGGICAYRTILEGLSMHDDSGCSLARIRILPGRIQYQGVTFDRIDDRYQDQADEFQDDLNHEGIDRKDLEFGFRDPSMVMEVQDSIKYLSVSYLMPNCRGLVLNVLPNFVTNGALGKYGLVHCRHPPGYNRGNRAVRGNVDFEVQTIGGKQVSLYRVPHEHSLYAALAISDIHDPRYLVVIDDKCVECAIQTALNQASPAHSVFVISV